MKKAVKSIGTILPNSQTFALNNKHAKDLEAKKKAAAGKAGLNKLRIEQTEFETRYWKDSKTYAVITSRLSVLWFECRSDGDYAVNQSERK